MKKRIFSIMIILLSFFTLKTNVLADETISVKTLEEYYNAFETIHNSSNESFTIILDDDIYVDDKDAIKNNSTFDNGNIVTIIGNNHKIHFSLSGYGRIRVSNATLYLSTEDEESTLTLEGGGEDLASGESLIAIYNGTVYMYEGVTLKDNISGNTAVDGGAVRLNAGAKFIMNGGLITNNSSDASSAGGGAIMLDGDDSEFTMNDGTISNNRADSWGGAILVFAVGTVTINKGEFIGNTASYGGAIATIDRPISIDNALFDGNEATYGGAIIAYDDAGGSSYEISDSKFINNEGNIGGAILAWGTSMTVEDSIVTKNNAASGGGVYLATGDCDLETTSVYNNKATIKGNDYYIDGGVSSLAIIEASDMDGYATYDDTNVNLLYWYSDVKDERYDLTNPTSIITASSLSTFTKYALTAAGDRVFVVKYESNGGTKIDEEVLDYGDKVTEPTDPTREEYLFLGWYTDEELTDEYDFDSEVTDDLTLYAKWSSLEYEFTSGANQKHTKGSSDDAVFELNADSSLLENGNLYIDDTLITDDDYTISGDTTITLKAEFLNSLSTGEHTLRVELNNGGSAETKFSIVEEESKDESKEDTINPATGDNVFNYLYLFAICTVLLMIINMNPYKNKYLKR